MLDQESLAERDTRNALDLPAQARLAAHAILHAHVLLVTLGAGMSADSGLAVYRDIANVDAYHKQGLTYCDICTTQWLETDPEIFYGFWGRCFNDYRQTDPHKGYGILREWRNKYFRPSGDASTARQVKQQEFAHLLAQTQERKIRERRTQSPLYTRYIRLSDSGSRVAESAHLIDMSRNELELSGFSEWYDGTDTPNSKRFRRHRDHEELAGPFFVYTSNVDGHTHKASFAPNEIYEIHGSTELWQCGSRCSREIWEAPRDFSFNVDPLSMRAQNIPFNQTAQDADTVLSADASSQPPVELNQDQDKISGIPGFTHNHPRCRRCSSLARPAVLMFGDFDWNEDVAAAEQYDIWKESIVDIFKQHRDQFKMVVLEIGAGTNVPTVRHQSREYIQMLPPHSCTLVRVNLDFPHVQNIRLKDYCIPIKGKALQVIELIDSELQKLAGAEGPIQSE